MRTITSEELRPLLEEGTIAVVDVRSAAEYEARVTERFAELAEHAHRS